MLHFLQVKGTVINRTMFSRNTSCTKTSACLKNLNSTTSQTSNFNKWQKKFTKITTSCAKSKILNVFHKISNIIERHKTTNKITNSDDTAAKTDFNKIAIILQNCSEDLLNKYINNLRELKKETTKFTLSKNKHSNEQSFLRLKKQGTRLITVCSDEIIKKSWRKLLRFNTKWKKYLNKNGLIYVHPDVILKNNLIKSGVITKRVPNEEELRDIALGVYTLNGLSESKSGQSIIVRSNTVLGIEAEAETTADLVERCIDLKSKKGILFKTTKMHQQNILNFSSIDIELIKDICEAKLSGVAVNANYCRVENMHKVIKFANKKNIFIMGI